MDHDDGVEGMTVACTGVVRPTGLLQRTKQYLGGVPAHVQAQIHKDKTACSVMVRAIVSKGFMQRGHLLPGCWSGCLLQARFASRLRWPLPCAVPSAGKRGRGVPRAALAALSVSGDLARNNMCEC